MNTIDNRRPAAAMVASMNRSSSDIANEFYAEHL